MERQRSAQVSFSDLEGQERARRFTITSQPSSANLGSSGGLLPTSGAVAAPPGAAPPSAGASHATASVALPSATSMGASERAPLGLNNPLAAGSAAVAPSRQPSVTTVPGVGLRKQSHIYLPQPHSSQLGAMGTVSPQDTRSTVTSRNNSAISTDGILLFFSQTATQRPTINPSFGSATSSSTSSRVVSRVTSPIAESPAQMPSPLDGATLQPNFPSAYRLNSPQLAKHPSPPPPPSNPIKINLPTSESNTAVDGKPKKQIVALPIGPLVPFQQYLTKVDDGKFHILIGCTGSVATIKVPLIIDKLFQTYGKSNVSIQLVVTLAASHFLRGLKVHNDVKIWRDEDEWANYSDQQGSTSTSSTSSAPKKPRNPYDKLILHNELRKWADIMVIAPLSANTLAKIANGIADNLLLSIVRSWGPPAGTNNVKKPILVAPAMNTFMYIHPITAKQLQIILSPEYGFGIEVLKPVEKVLVCGDIGMGGMREWLDIVDIVRRRLSALRPESESRGDDEDDDSEASAPVDDDGDEDDDDDDDDQEVFHRPPSLTKDAEMIFDITDDAADVPYPPKEFVNPPETQNII